MRSQFVASDDLNETDRKHVWQLRDIEVTTSGEGAVAGFI
jgi:hypothetical protein